ncbi:MAG: hypothetical protein ABI934_13215 [Actinomycetota bacterium]
MRRWRYALVAAGVLLLLYGGVRLVAEVPEALPGLVLWMVGIVVIHDGLLSPLVVGVGWLLARTVPPSGRRYLQAALVVGGLITIIAIPLIARRGTQPPAKALLLQNYGANLAILLGLVATLNLAAYLLTAARRRLVDGARGRQSSQV